ncbi:uncharacterized protein LOC124665901 [Lolium rigidum]|uniref:uncharacterized protein LOC124665901 n=1 Tax=Lolium rigidum TaxID=89674 RepID=UPI001F5C87FB|nr:uncharacterized protein LOC124665901 [Lolium rigidum]
MASSCCSKRPRPMIAKFVPLLLVLFVASCSWSASASPDRSGGNGTQTTQFRSGDELRAYRRILARMDRLKKASVKTIQSPDGDVIHCVPAHQQPAFDHPKMRGQKPEDEPEERPKISTDAAEEDAVFTQAWSDGGEACPSGTVPIRRTTERDLQRYSSSGSLRRYGMKPRASVVRRDSTSDGHEHAVGYVTGDQFYGAKASLNVWPAKVASAAEFSLSQIWVISGTFGNDLNTIEAGWQVSPELYGDNSPRFFTYWTSDAYQATGCYNLHCSGFIQTNNRIAIGAAITPASAYNGRQFDISLLLWKDPRRGHWWLQLGSGPLVGYWPSRLFTHLGGHANMVQFGGEVVNTRPSGSHTPTQMGSGHFPREGFNRAAYFRNVQVVDWDNNLIPARDLRLVADHPACYGIQGGYNRAWGNYFYYGGPGRNVRCP